LSSQQYIDHLLESAASADNPRVRRMMAGCVEAIDRRAFAKYERDARDTTPAQLACVLRELADHVEQQLSDAVGREWAERFRQDAADLEEHA
jgi:hypothetical protein